MQYIERKKRKFEMKVLFLILVISFAAVSSDVNEIQFAKVNDTSLVINLNSDKPYTSEISSALELTYLSARKCGGITCTDGYICCRTGSTGYCCPTKSKCDYENYACTSVDQ